MDDINPIPVLSHSMAGSSRLLHPQCGGLEQDEVSGGRAGMGCPAWDAPHGMHMD